jgi:hypothetical protein
MLWKAPLHRLWKNSRLLLIYRCDKRIVLAAALAAEGDCCPRDDFSRILFSNARTVHQKTDFSSPRGKRF